MTDTVLPSPDSAVRPAAEWNRTEAVWPTAAYPELLAEQTARTPDAPAVVQGARVLSYRELAAETDRLAALLQTVGAAPGHRIGLCYPRGADYLIGAVAILKTGAAIVALDPVNPDERLAFMLRDAAPLAVLAPAPVADRLPGGCPVLDVGTDLAVPGTRPAPVPLTADTVSHLIYTSGSTGTPKAVLERHGAIVNLVHWTRRAYGVRPGDRASWLSTPGFAVQIMEWLPYLAIGAAVHVPEAGQAQTPEQIRDWLVGAGITHTMLVAALAERAWGLDWPADTALRIMVTTAERVHSWPPGDLPFTVVMTYGTTETTNVLSCLDLGAGIDFTTRATDPAVRAERPVPVGRPIANLRVHLLDEQDRPVPVGEVGRLHVAGAGLALGYHDRPELTTAKFRRNPAPELGEEVLYDTGDLARYRPDGAVELLGRGDAQVKVRGFRVELGEVETVVARLAGVREAVVLAHEEAPGDLRLIAYVAAEPDGALEPGDIRARVARHLPYYMVPSAVLVVAALPRLANGKVDRKQLPPPPQAREAVQTGYAAPRDELEDGLCRIWSALFRAPQIGIHDNFFELGGHSLLAFQLIDAVRRGYATELSLPDLSAHPTVAELAELIASGRRTGTAAFAGLPPITPDPEHRFDPFPLTESQQAMWIGRGGLVELGNVGCHGYFEWESQDFRPDRFALAWRRLVERHDALRTVINPDGTQQVLVSPPDYAIESLDLTGHSEEDAGQRLAALRERLSHQVLDSDRWPLFDVRVSLLPTVAEGALRARIHLSLDFLIADAWSYFQVLIPDLIALYEDPDAELPPLELTFRDYVLGTQVGIRETELYRRSQWYWKDRLATLPPAPALPERAAGPDGADGGPVRFQRRSHVLESQQWRLVQQHANELEVTPSGALAAAFAEVLSAWSGQSRFTINFPLFNRLPLHPQVNSLLGDTTTTLLLAVERTEPTFAGRAQELQRRLWADLEHRYFSGVQVLRELTKLRGSLAPAMPIVMTSLAGHPAGLTETALGVPVYGISQTPQVSLDFQVFERSGGLAFNWDYLPSLYPDGLIEEMFDAFVSLLEGLADPRAWQREEFGLLPSVVGAGALLATTAPVAGPPAERDTSDAWEAYWAGIERTGRGGDVLWDADDPEELAWCAAVAERYFRPGLPVIDLGCGNGRYSRALAESYPRVVGVDVSRSAIEHAIAEGAGLDNVSYHALDMTDRRQAADLGSGPYNIFVRGVLHILDDAGRAALAEVVEELLGPDGVLIVHEPDYSAGSFGYVGFVGGSKGRAADLVGPLEAAGVRHSATFASAELRRFFPGDRWEVLADEEVTLHAIDPRTDAGALRLPGHFAVLRRTRGK
ncbi:non-ribosomal peptide synthetase [Kitasatospora acidiphila]|uniref:non-ribosomal peptide synthetase n=1 Tax=Kitasatospora acidiphila TaxID=2567942 RepID=UPI0015F0F566|nr:non-ribosomal peptide synthetase [Kitasatospora acidiphila]